MDLNKSTEDEHSVVSVTQANWYFWDGGFLVLAASDGALKSHSHHAIQIVIALDGEPAICTDDKNWLSGQGFIVLPNVRHSYDGRNCFGALLLIDPNSFEGHWLVSNLKTPITFLTDSQVSKCRNEILKFYHHPFESMTTLDLIKFCLSSLNIGSLPARRPDPRITRSLIKINASNNLRVSQEEIAAEVCLSPSRFAHLFKQQVGLPLRRYLLWRKLSRAVLAIARGESMTDAAHAADFSDSAHLTRTFNEMFGIKPSTMMQGKFFEIPSPFTATELEKKYDQKSIHLI